MFSNMFGEGGGGGGGFAGFADLFAQQQRQAQMRGPDVQAQMRITLREAAEGVRKNLHIPIRSIHGKRETRKVEVDIPAGEQQVCRLMFVLLIAPPVIMLMAAEAYLVCGRRPNQHPCNMLLLMTLLYKPAAHHAKIRYCIMHPRTVTSWYKACA